MQPSVNDFMTSSQITAMTPQLNSSQGPQLVQCYEYPNPTYRTLQPIILQQNKTEKITVTFLSHNANNCMIDVQGEYFFAATTSSKFLTRLDAEAYGVDLLVTGLMPGQSKATITVSGCIPPITVFVEVLVTSPPFVPSPPPPQPQILPVSTSIHNSMVNSYRSPVVPVSTSVHNSGVNMYQSPVLPVGTSLASGSANMSGSWRASQQLKNSGHW